MPQGARTSLAALILLIGVGAATAEPAAGTTWTDPPTHKPAADAPASDRKAAAPAPAAAPTASTPAAVAAEARPAPAKRKTAARHVPARTTATRSAPARIAARRAAPERLAASVRRARVAAAPPRVIVGPRAVALVPPQEGYARYRPYGYGPGYGPGYADERLDSLHSAAAAGYLVVRRRTVQFPDGRTLRVYRPDDGEPF
ncbi:MULTISPECIES: hypothetical protein [unclassified Methylobacterium]|uniref:hypothetical protein n=1 Tax=unclassified Methylobacterium TaxID=2615210 RepID=UPI001FBA4634|nr:MULTISPECIES: hypothetical protein [unclassified Methylobacterium]MCJ2021660.1 hypothetical protein [Methylobacterium sp. E-065]